MEKKKTVKIILSVIVAVALVAVIITAFVFLGMNKGPFTGVVTENGTGNPISGVCITDGRNVVKTDENGKFEIKGLCRYPIQKSVKTAQVNGSTV